MRKPKRKFRNGKKALLLVLLALVLGYLGVRIFRGGIHSLQLAEYPLRYEEYVEYYADKYSLDPMLVYSFIRTESGFDPQAHSNVDARGLMQITEETFQWIQSKIAPDEEHTFEELYDPELNIRFGVYYLYACLERYGGDLATAASAYHSGWGTVDELLEDSECSPDGERLTVFPYTQMRRYVAKIQSSYENYQRLYGQAEEGETA